MEAEPVMTNDDGQRQQRRVLSVAADEFTADQNWRTLPDRLQRLVQVLQDCNANNNDNTNNGNGSPEILCAFSKDPDESRRIAITAAVLASADCTTKGRSGSLVHSFQALFRASLESRQMKLQQNGDETSDEDMNESVTAADAAVEEEDELFANGADLALFEHLRILGWIRSDGFLMPALGTAVHRAILAKVKATISGDFEEEGFFQTIEAWCESTVEVWVQDLVGMEGFETENWAMRLRHCAAQCFCLVRIEEIFDIVCEFPDSRPAVAEIQVVMERTKMHSQLGDALRKSLVRRLNHPGANTSQIIDCYINTIKVLREIDPSDRLLSVVTAPVRSYLRARNDTVRCIITSLTDAEAGGDLYEELRRQDGKPIEAVNEDSDDEEECPTLDWQPAPSIMKPKGSFLVGGKGGNGDILAMLVSIYGSKELFVNEYRVMLADKLLSNLDYNTDKEVHTLELLKLRFGELSMRNCEIMIKDMDDSKRAVSNIHSTINASGKPAPMVDSAVVSHIFWPPLQNEQLKHHPRIQAGLDQFSAEFCRLKNPRRLIWLNQLGTVHMELDVEEEGKIETRDFHCSPLLATLISHFEDRETLTSDELSDETGIAEHIIQKRMGYWVSNRVVKIIPSSQSGVVYQVASQEHLLQGEHDVDSAMMDLDHGDNQAVSLFAQEEEEMGTYQSYVLGMLTNLGALPLEKIHNMLKMYVSGSDVKFNKTPQQLSTFLKYLCKQEILECGPDGMYKLYKK